MHFFRKARFNMKCGRDPPWKIELEGSMALATDSLGFKCIAVYLQRLNLCVLKI